MSRSEGMTNHVIGLRFDLEMDSGMAENGNWVGRSRSMVANGSFIRKTGDERNEEIRRRTSHTIQPVLYVQKALSNQQSHREF